MKKLQIFYAFLLIPLLITPAFGESIIRFDVDTTTLTPGEIIELTGKVGVGLEGQPVAIEVSDSNGNIILIRTVTSDSNGDFILKFKVPLSVESGEFEIVTNIEIDGESFTESKSVDVIEPEPMMEAEPIPEPEPMMEAEPIPEPEPMMEAEPMISETLPEPKCGTGTILQDGICVIDKSQTTESKSSGGGCLIATATFDSELAPQVQKLREIRDSKLLSTESGSQFMESFNQFYYSFSPIIADYERENPVFKEIVKIGITPMISTLSLMDYADTESEVLGIGISLIILNAMMYVGLPVFGIMIAKKRF